MAKQLQAGFDYGDMPEGQSSQLCCLAGYIGKAKGELVTSIVEIGKHVHAARAILTTAGCEGRFSAWVKAECGFSLSTAYHYIDGFNYLGGGNRPSLGRLFTAEAVYLLGAAKSPKSAGDAAIRLAEKGNPVNRAIAARLIKKHAPKDATAPVEGEEGTAVGESDGEAEAPLTVHGKEPDSVGGREASTNGASAPVVTTKEAMAEENKALESWARKITATLKEAPESKWLDKNRLAQIESHLRAASSTARAVKGHGLCPKCEGGGCKPCRWTGWLNRVDLESCGAQ